MYFGKIINVKFDDDNWYPSSNELIEAEKKDLKKLKKYNMKSFTGFYNITDCENEGDIKYAEKEVTNAGGIVDKVLSEIKDENIDDYYESRNWTIQFHCNTKKQFNKTCKELRINL